MITLFILLIVLVAVGVAGTKKIWVTDKRQKTEKKLQMLSPRFVEAKEDGLVFFFDMRDYDKALRDREERMSVKNPWARSSQLFVVPGFVFWLDQEVLHKSDYVGGPREYEQFCKHLVVSTLAAKCSPDEFQSFKKAFENEEEFVADLRTRLIVQKWDVIVPFTNDRFADLHRAKYPKYSLPEIMAYLLHRRELPRKSMLSQTPVE